VRIDGRKIGFTGDLLWGDGRILDLYSLQDAIEGTRIRGYHGYAGRIGRLLASLRKVREERCDLLVPSRGPVIGNPEQAINALIERLQAVYANYLSINAGRWYFKDDYDTLAEKALNPGRQVAWMPWAETINEQPPDWIRVISNSRLIVSQDRSAFLVDCGSEKIFREIRRLQDEGAVTSVDGLFITHYHDDHTDFANQAAKAFDCPVYATEQSADILAHPRAYHLPAMTPNPVENIRVVPDGFEMRWKEFSLRFFYFPGQTIYHDALLLTRDNGETIFFIGDSFSPSGIDDYCLLNRNLLQENTGYFHCLDFLKKLPPETLLINEHITQPFAFNSAQVAMMTETLRERLLLCRELFPWDDPNYGLDEQWIRFEPYSMELQRGSSGKIAIKVFNHSPKARVFKVRINVPDGLRVSPEAGEISVGPRQAGNLSCTVSAAGEEPGDVACPGVLTADVLWEKNGLREWCEALVMIGP